MKLPFELLVALRFLREGRMQTLLIVGGVTIGVAVIVFLTATPIVTPPTMRSVCILPSRRKRRATSLSLIHI